MKITKETHQTRHGRKIASISEVSPSGCQGYSYAAYFEGYSYLFFFNLDGTKGNDTNSVWDLIPISQVVPTIKTHITRDGRRLETLVRVTQNPNILRQLSGVIEGENCVRQWTIDGKFYHNESEFDLVPDIADVEYEDEATK